MRVIKSTQTENILSLKKEIRNHHSQLTPNKQVGVNVSGAIIALTQIIHKILNISDPITFHTHKSYLLLAIAATVVAISGKLVPAATIVAQIAHSLIQNWSAINTADFTMSSEEITSNHKLTTNIKMVKLMAWYFVFEKIFGISFKI